MSRAVDRVLGWDVPTAGIAVVDPDAIVDRAGSTATRLWIASVSKPLSACAVLIAVEEGAIELDEPAGPPGSTVRHLLAHTSGYGFDLEAGVIGPPGTRRIYSNRGYEELAKHVETATGIAFAEYLAEAVFEPLGMASTRLEGSAAHAVWSTVDDLALFARFLLRSSLELPTPPVLTAESFALLVQVAFPGLDGVLPGLGRFTPLDWGLGMERNFGRPGHWSGEQLRRSTFGHFGSSGSFLWVDPERSVASVYLGDRDWGPWAVQAWPPLCDAIVGEYAAAAAAVRMP